MPYFEAKEESHFCSKATSKVPNKILFIPGGKSFYDMGLLSTDDPKLKNGKKVFHELPVGCRSACKELNDGNLQYECINRSKLLKVKKEWKHFQPATGVYHLKSSVKVINETKRMINALHTNALEHKKINYGTKICAAHIRRFDCETGHCRTNCNKFWLNKLKSSHNCSTWFVLSDNERLLKRIQNALPELQFMGEKDFNLGFDTENKKGMGWMINALRLVLTYSDIYYETAKSTWSRDEFGDYPQLPTTSSNNSATPNFTIGKKLNLDTGSNSCGG